MSTTFGLHNCKRQLPGLAKGNEQIALKYDSCGITRVSLSSSDHVAIDGAAVTTLLIFFPVQARKNCKQ